MIGLTVDTVAQADWEALQIGAVYAVDYTRNEGYTCRYYLMEPKNDRTAMKQVAIYNPLVQALSFVKKPYCRRDIDVINLDDRYSPLQRLKDTP